MRLRRNSQQFIRGLKKAGQIATVVGGLLVGAVGLDAWQKAEQKNAMLEAQKVAMVEKQKAQANFSIDWADDKYLWVNGILMTPEEAYVKFPAQKDLIKSYVYGSLGANYMSKENFGTMIRWADSLHLTVNDEEVMRPESVYQMYPQYEKDLRQWVAESDPVMHRQVETSGALDIETGVETKEYTFYSEREMFGKEPNLVVAPYYYIAKNGKVTKSNGYYGDTWSEEGKKWCNEALEKVNREVYGVDVIDDSEEYLKDWVNQSAKKHATQNYTDVMQDSNVKTEPLEDWVDREFSEIQKMHQVVDEMQR